MRLGTTPVVLMLLLGGTLPLAWSQPQDNSSSRPGSATVASALRSPALGANPASSSTVASPNPRGDEPLRSVLMPLQDLQISSRAAGVIERCPVEEGDRVKAGQPILELNHELEQADVAQAQATVTGAQSELAKAQKEFDRAQSMRRENLNSEKQFEETRYQLEGAKSRSLAAEAILLGARIRLQDRAVRSPVDGIFFKRLKNVGEAVDKFETVARVIDDSKLEMTVYCRADFLGVFQPNAEVRVKLLDGPGKDQILTAQISHIDELIDSKSGTFRVKMTLSPGGPARVGLAASLLAPGR